MQPTINQTQITHQQTNTSSKSNNNGQYEKILSIGANRKSIKQASSTSYLNFPGENAGQNEAGSCFVLFRRAEAAADQLTTAAHQHPTVTQGQGVGSVSDAKLTIMEPPMVEQKNVILQFNQITKY